MDVARVSTKRQGDSYDLILANHTGVLMVPPWIDGFRIYTSHGPQHRFEIPAEGADVYVGVSEEVVKAREPQMPGDWRVITNGLQLSEFYSWPSDNEPPRALIFRKSADASNMAPVVSLHARAG